MAAETEAAQARRASARRNRNRFLPSAQSIKSIGGLVAVVVGVIAVTVLAIATMAFIRNGRDANAMIPLATAAFGVISAVVGAYLGIKIGTDQSAHFAEDAKVAHAQLGALRGFVDPARQHEADRALTEAAKPPAASQ